MKKNAKILVKPRQQVPKRLPGQNLVWQGILSLVFLSNTFDEGVACVHQNTQKLSKKGNVCQFSLKGRALYITGLGSLFAGGLLY
jgi:hypothetical protein